MFKKQGFSLVELMVVVAIIGILASIAVPQMNRYSNQARQTEAKTNLSSLYTAEKAFFAEYNTYFHGFRQIGFAPEGDLRYRIGFSAVSEGNAPTNLTKLRDDFGYVGGTVTGEEFNSGTYCTAEARCNELIAAKNANGATAKVTNRTEFVAQAVGSLDDDETLDVWEINQWRHMINACNDVNQSSGCDSAT